MSEHTGQVGSGTAGPGSAATTLEARLSAAFATLDTRPDFDSRLMARLRAESRLDVQRASEALAREQERYLTERLAVRSLGHRLAGLGSVISLESVGITALVVMLVAATVPVAQLQLYAPAIITGIGVLAGLSPFLGRALRSVAAAA